MAVCAPVCRKCRRCIRPRLSLTERALGKTMTPYTYMQTKGKGSEPYIVHLDICTERKSAEASRQIAILGKCTTIVEVVL